MIEKLQTQFTTGTPPLVAILRGIESDEAVGIAKAIVHSGIRLLEVPLNSPNPFSSIRNMVESLGDDAICGAGTVLTVGDVERLHDVGGQLVVSPNCDVDVIKKTLSLGMISMPGVATPTEAFSAINAGARYLKLFPAAGVGENYLKNMMAVFPKTITVLAVGGINASNMHAFWQAGARGFGIGSDLYSPGDSPDSVAAKSVEILRAFNAIQE